MTNKPVLKNFVVVRPVGEGIGNTYSGSTLRYSPDPRNTAIAIARDVAIVDDDTLVEWRIVRAAEESEARLRCWPQGVRYRNGTFRLADLVDAHNE
jgi:hypothetical protein